MKRYCPNSDCSQHKIRKVFKPVGQYFRSSDSKWINRYKCNHCNHFFSAATFSPCYQQNKRRLNCMVRKLLCEGNSQRGIARILNISRVTVARKLKFLAAQARLSQRQYLQYLQQNKVQFIQFDDMETFEHTNCKPLSISLAVESKTRKILAFEVSQMPSKGKLASFSREKYGKRADERANGWEEMFKTLAKVVSPSAEIKSDKNTNYARYIKKYFPKSKYRPVKGRAACVTGQAELKKGGYDPIFSLNHTCAMLRDRLSRLVRKTWCTTKSREALLDHIALYVDHHNENLTA